MPIFTARGAGGGIELIDGFQTHLTGLTADEAQCLFLVGQPQVAHRLGLGAPTRTARNKLLNAIAPTLADDADHLVDVVPARPRPVDRQSHPARRAAAPRAVHPRTPRGRAHDRARTDRDGSPARPRAQGRLVAPGRLEATRPSRSSCIDELRATRLTNQRFAPPADFDLAEFWRLHNLTPNRTPPALT